MISHKAYKVNHIGVFWCLSVRRKVFSYYKTHGLNKTCICAEQGFRMRQWLFPEHFTEALAENHFSDVFQSHRYICNYTS